MKKLDYSFFKSEMTKLAEQFGASKFSERKGHLIYKAVQYLDERQFSYIVDDMIGNNRFAPNVIDFQDKARKFKNESKISNSCAKCFGGGLISLYEKTTGRNFAFSCICDVGRAFVKIPNISTINLNLYTKFAPITLEPNKAPYGDFKNRYRSYLDKLSKTPKNGNQVPITMDFKSTSNKD